MNDHQHQQQQSSSAPGRKEDNLQKDNLKDNLQNTSGRAGFTPKPTPLTEAFSSLGKNPPTSPLQMAAAELGKNPPKTSLSEAMQMFKVNYQSPSPSLPAQAMLDEEAKDEEKVQMKEGDSSVSVSSGSTGSLPGSVLGKMEGAFGTSFSDVNVHSNSSKASDMGALAYAQGNNIHFAPGQYNPDSKEGQELIGHELTHVVQQRQGRVQATTQAKGVAVNDDPALEQEADEMGRKAASITEDQTTQPKAAKSLNGTGDNTPVQRFEAQDSDSEVTTEELTATDAPRTSKISEANGTITVTIYDAACNEYTKDLRSSIADIRTWIIDSYNWNAIIKILKFAASKVGSFDYAQPTNLKGTSEDDTTILPTPGILAIVNAQLQDSIAQNSCSITAENQAAILANVDGLPGASFASIMGEESQNAIRDEEGNDTMTREDGTDIDIPDFSSDSEETLYDFMRDITLARNGLWSDEKDIVNLTGLRRELEISESEDHLVQWNDTMAASWIEHDDDCNEIKRCKHYTATTEPGNRDANRMMTPQTATVLLGLHVGRQSAGRVMSPLLKGSDSDGNAYDFDRSNLAGINVHPGGMTGLRGGLGVENQKLSGFPGAYGATSTEDVNTQLLLVEIFHLLSKYGKNRDDSAYNFLKQEAEAAQELKDEGLEITNEQESAISDLKRIDKILENDVFTTSRKTYLKNTIEFNEEQEENIFKKEEEGYSLNELNDMSTEISGTVSGSNVSASSEGCQVIFGGKSFYDYWWNATNKAENSGQKRWYYTLINLSDAYEAIETQEGQL